MPKGRERNRQRAIARLARPKPWGDLPRGTHPCEGLLFIDKDQGVTSHDIVGALRRLGATRQVGHAGTLDPMATGLLIVATGRLTKLIQYLVGADKTYEARICLGVGSNTDDAEGELHAGPPVHADDAAIDAVLTNFIGDIMQVPATVSAIKVDGKRAHDRAREGEEVTLAARPIHVERFARTSPVHRRAIDGELAARVAEFDVVVTASSGTYVRALARDVGQALGTEAHLTALRRTEIGPWNVTDAYSVADLKGMIENDQGLPVVSMAQVCRQVFPVIDIDDAEARALRNGLFIDKRAPISAGTRADRWPAAAFCGDEAVALVSPRSGKLKPDLQLTL
ncbi:tRNA pseudouridine(55) synthase TruB [Trueperella pyogenes]|uniref:tRNA pseudouridine(55) synthase TruB n=1 Tax=Trueperella pyogenes TaxID=1661 RepID=UPI002169F3DE|nr:tRNA pseudouridine(55) synthase TruB [Trueperella pyogenes]